MLKYHIMSDIMIPTDKLKQFRISGDILKLIAAFAMLIDHASFGILHAYLVKNAMSILPQTYTKLNNLYEIGRGIGRIAMPIFAFFIVEGFFRTSNLKKYITRIAVFAILAEIPFDLGLYGTYLYIDHQNVLFTFLIGILMMASVRYINALIPGLSNPVRVLVNVSAVIAFADVAYMTKCDYSFKCILLIAVLYYFRNSEYFRLLLGGAITCWEKYAPISFVLLYFYDPEVKPRLKYFFYIFYPAHLLIIFLINVLIIRM